MKYFAAIVLIAAVATAQPTDRRPSAVISQIIEAISALKPGSVVVGPAIVDTEPISVGPAIINPIEGISVGPAIINPIEGISIGPAIVEGLEPISVGPAIVDFPLPDGGAVAESVVAPSPVAIIPGPVADVSGSAPLVQIIVNINQAAESSPIAVSPVDIAAPEIKPDPVQIVDAAPEPVQVVEVAPIPSPISPPIAVNPIGVVAPEVEPVQIGVPVIPEAAVVLPEELN